MKAVGAWTRGRAVLVLLADGRVKAFAADRYPRLKAASSTELAAVRLSCYGTALRWDDPVDEDLTVAGVCREGQAELFDVEIPRHIRAAWVRVAGGVPHR